jgi:hypothetical protein
LTNARIDFNQAIHRYHRPTFAVTRICCHVTFS